MYCPLRICQVHSNLSAGHGLLVELLITFELVFTVFATCDPRRTDLGGSAGLAIGFAVAVGHLFAVSVSLPLHLHASIRKVHIKIALILRCHDSDRIVCTTVCAKVFNSKP